MKLNCQDRSGNVQSMTNMKYDNDMIDCTGVISVEYDYELSISIRW